MDYSSGSMTSDFEIGRQSEVLLLVLVLAAVVICTPTDSDPTNPEIGDNHSPLDPSGTFFLKSKLVLKKVLLGK
ncbi:hypothetical protein C0J52_10146 [Blattella germanica]|nr:hypothetical protein C0J52_10146 [Blattella germanica]